MTEIGEIYKCNVCGNIVAVLHEGVGELVCCGQPMELLKEKTQDVGSEKHVPIIETTSGEKATGSVRVKVGAVPHPMEEKHYIEWVELNANGAVYRKFLKPGDKPEAEFALPAAAQGKKIYARIYCNVHGLWKSQ